MAHGAEAGKKNWTVVAVGTTKKGGANVIYGIVLRGCHHHTRSAFHRISGETQFGMAGAGAGSFCVSGCDIPVAVHISGSNAESRHKNPPTRDGFLFARNDMNQPASCWFAASTATPRLIGALRRPSASSSALRHRSTLPGVLAWPIRPMRHTFPAIAPRPAPISRL